MTAPAPQIEHLLDSLRAEFGDRMDEAGIARVREQLARIVETSAALAAAPIANGDEPASVFHALVKE